MTEHSKIELGVYLNLFPADVPQDLVKVMVTDRSQYQNLQLLRDELKTNKVQVYADNDKIYGYGDDSITLKEKGFNVIEICLYNTPYLTGRMILEGFLERVRQDNYEVIERKGRCEVFNWNEINFTRDGNVKVFRGFDLRSIFLLNHNNNKLIFGLVVDVTYALRDKTDQHLNFHVIRHKFGNKTLLEVRQIQGDLIPTGINTEVARQRLLEHILPFVKRFSRFSLPCNLDVNLHHEPIRVVLGGDRL
jgi:hypothetical protein